MWIIHDFNYPNTTLLFFLDLKLVDGKLFNTLNVILNQFWKLKHKYIRKCYTKIDYNSFPILICKEIHCIKKIKY